MSDVATARDTDQALCEPKPSAFIVRNTFIEVPRSPSPTRPAHRRASSWPNLLWGGATACQELETPGAPSSQLRRVMTIVDMQDHVVDESDDASLTASPAQLYSSDDENYVMSSEHAQRAKIFEQKLAAKLASATQRTALNPRATPFHQAGYVVQVLQPSITWPGTMSRTFGHGELTSQGAPLAASITSEGGRGSIRRSRAASGASPSGTSPSTVCTTKGRVEPLEVRNALVHIIVMAETALKGCSHVRRVEIQEHDQGWSLAACFKASHLRHCRHALRGAKDAMTQAAASNDQVLILGGKGVQIEVTPNGLGINVWLATVNDPSSVCWELKTSGTCARGLHCRWAHPAWQASVEITARLL